MTPPKADVRKHRFSMVMTDEERDRLEALADSDRRSAADWVRNAIHAAYEERFGGKKKPKR
jgi:predicted DNA-binding protein